MELKEELNPVQLEAVTHKDGPLLVIAGAGSGKTRIITYRIANLIQSGVPAWSILGVTFTNKAAGEMKTRIEQLVNGSPFISTFHSFCALLLRNEIQHLGYKPNYIIYDDVDSKNLVKQIIGSDDAGKGYTPKEIASTISYNKNRGISPEKHEAIARTSTERFIAKVYAEYQRRLKVNNAVDFDDLLILAVQILETFPEVRKKYEERFRYVLVDEYQDTNKLQYALIRLLAEHHGNICAVGDPDQSIYQWRGADITNILSFEHDFPGARIITLEQNYRSTKLILEAANNVIRNNSERKEKTLWTEHDEGDKPIYFIAGDDRDETDFVARTITELHLGQNIPYKDFAIFYRTNAQSRLFEEQFFIYKIPFAVVGNVGFYERKEIKDLVAYLRVLTAPEDSLSLIRIINTPARGIGDTTVNRLRALASREKLTAYNAMLRVDEAEGITSSIAKRIKDFSGFISELRARIENGERPVAITELLMKKIGYREHLLKDKERGEDRNENVDEFLSAMSLFEREYPEGTLEEFLQQTALFTDVDTWESDADKVALMTMHNSKGLEFPVVFVVGLEEGLSPHQNSMDSDKAIEEERRLFYVCLTRAKRMAYLSSAMQRLRFGDITFSNPSRFIEEIPQRILDVRGRETAAPASRFVASSDDFYDELDEAPRPKPKAAASFESGDHIVHPLYGEGEVLDVEETSAGQICRIQFISGGQVKTIAAKFARMKKL